MAGLLLKEYRDSFRGSPLAATWSYLKIWAADSLPANPLVTHETGGGGRWLVLGGGGCSEGGWQGRLAVCPGWLFSTAPPLLH